MKRVHLGKSARKERVEDLDFLLEKENAGSRKLSESRKKQGGCLGGKRKSLQGEKKEDNKEERDEGKGLSLSFKGTWGKSGLLRLGCPGSLRKKRPLDVNLPHSSISFMEKKGETI